MCLYIKLNFLFKSKKSGAPFAIQCNEMTLIDILFFLFFVFFIKTRANIILKNLPHNAIVSSVLRTNAFASGLF